MEEVSWKNRNGTTDKAETQIIWEDISIDIGWGIIRGKKLGLGSRKVLAVHGWLDNANTFDLVAPYIKDESTIISIDLPGHGLSDHFPQGFIYDTRSYVGAIKKVITKLAWNNFTYLAHSFGAIVGIVYSAVFPEDVNTLISIDIIKPWSFKPEDYASHLRKYFQNYFKNEEHSSRYPLEYEEDELIQKTIAGSKSLDNKSAKILLERSSKLSDCGKKRILTRDLRAKVYFIGFETFDVWFEFAKSIKCPILILKAKNGRIYESPEEHEIMQNAFKDGSPLYQYFEIEGKHHLHLTNSEIVGPILKEFFQLSNPHAEKAVKKIHA